MAVSLGQTIYGLAKTGKVKEWRCWVETSGWNGVIKVGYKSSPDASEVIRTEVISQGKNIGRSNETSPIEQALKEAEARYAKKLKSGYSITPHSCSLGQVNSLGHPMPQLAKVLAPEKITEDEARMWWQPKLDGHRCILISVNGEVKMYSRRGTWITAMDHITSFAGGKIEDGTYLDGELYIHGEKLQDIGSLIKKKQPGSERVVLHAYDAFRTDSSSFTKGTFRSRRTLLDANLYSLGTKTTNPLNAKHYEGFPIIGVKTSLIADINDAMKLTESAIVDGYEGGILRLDSCPYRAGFRSDSLLKIKKFDDSEHTIVDVVLGKNHGISGTKVACFLCETPKGKIFEVIAPGTFEEKAEVWANKDDYLHRVLTVKHSGYTKDGIPWHPVALRYREDI